MRRPRRPVPGGAAKPPAMRERIPARMRIDMTSRDWHELVRPVLPHAFVTKDWPELSHVRIELGDKALYAVASDKYTLGAERHPLARDEQHQAMPPVHVLASEV